jgi:hypothetical protein
LPASAPATIPRGSTRDVILPPASYAIVTREPPGVFTSVKLPAAS